MRNPVRVVVVSSYLPWPLDRGDPLRVFGLSESLGHIADAELWAVRRRTGGDEPGLAAAFPGRLRCFPVDRCPANRFAHKSWMWLDGLRHGVPPWVRDRESRALARALREEAHRFDAVVLVGEAAGVYAAPSAGCPLVIWDKANVIAASAIEIDRNRPLRRAVLVPLSRRYERRTLKIVGRSVVTSVDEGRRLLEMHGTVPDAVIPSGVEPARSSRASAASGTVGWMGQFLYVPNRQGLASFLTGGWREAAAAGLTLELIGPDTPDDELMAIIAAAPCVRYRGYVEDTAPWLESLSAAVVPVWSGAGIKMKTLGFLAAGVPVVGTPCAFEGIDARHGVTAVLGETPAELGAALADLAGDQERARRIGDEGQALVAAEHAWPAIARTYAQMIECWLATPAAGASPDRAGDVGDRRREPPFVEVLD